MKFKDFLRITFAILELSIFRLLFSYFPGYVFIGFLTGLILVVYNTFKGQSLKEILFFGILPSVLLFFIILIDIIFNFSKIVNLFMERFENEYSNFANLYGTLGINVDKELLQETKSIIPTLVKLTPATELLFSIAGILLFYIIFQKILSEKNIPKLGLSFFTNWKAPDWFLWIFSLGLILSFVQKNLYLNILGFNILAIALSNYILQGLAITQFKFMENETPTFFRIFIYIFIIIQPIFLIPIAIIGIIDIWKDFRNINFQEEI